MRIFRKIKPWARSAQNLGSIWARSARKNQDFKRFWRENHQKEGLDFSSTLKPWDWEFSKIFQKLRPLSLRGSDFELKGGVNCPFGAYGVEGSDFSLFVCLSVCTLSVVTLWIDPKRNPKIRQFRRNNGKIWSKTGSFFRHKLPNPFSDVGCVTQDAADE